MTDTEGSPKGGSVKLKANLAMMVSKTFSGLNQNALRYLLPRWMSAYSGVVMRLVFATAFYWVYGLVSRPTTKASVRDRLELMGIGAVCVFGYMFFLLEGLSYTTPVSSSIFICLQPVWVFIICVILKTERSSAMKIGGIVLGLAGAMIIVVTQPADDTASNPLSGDMMCLCSSVLYAIFLVLEKHLLKRLDKVTVMRWTFLGGVFPAAVMICFTGWYAPVLTAGLTSTAMLCLLFVLIFPTSVSYLLLAMGLRNLSATVVALYGYLILVVSAIVSYITGQDNFSWWQILSMAMIAGSVYFVEIAEKKQASGPEGKHVG